jgi:hypothetical protein
MLRLRHWLTAGVFLGTLGCSDIVEPRPGPAPAGPRDDQAVWIDGIEYPYFEDEATARAQGTARIKSINTEVFWVEKVATGFTSMKFRGNHGEFKVNFTVSEGGTTYDQKELNRARRYVFAGEHELKASQRHTIEVPKNCGFRARVSGDYAARTISWVPALGLFESGLDDTSYTEDAAQPACPCPNTPATFISPNSSSGASILAYEDRPYPGCTGDGGNGGGSDGGGVVWCFTVTTDYYEYDPNTGEVRHLRTTQESFCYNMT